jgi:uncharacterized protein
MEMNSYPNGMFCWSELTAMDVQKAKRFYAELFSWGMDESPIDDEGNVYIMLQKNGADLGAMYNGKAELERTKMNTHWLGYIAVDSVDQTVAKVESLGGQVSIKPMDVFTAGRMAVIHDPSGARFALWQGNEHKGAKRIGETSTVCWNELATRDLAASIKFYQGLFNWSAETKPVGDSSYTEFTLAGQPVAGMIEMTDEWGDVPPHWMTYYAVDDCDSSVAKAAELGAHICVPATDIPDVGRFSVIADPQGAVFSVIKLVDELQS